MTDIYLNGSPPSGSSRCDTSPGGSTHADLPSSDVSPKSAELPPPPHKKYSAHETLIIRFLFLCIVGFLAFTFYTSAPSDISSIALPFLAILAIGACFGEPNIPPSNRPWGGTCHNDPTNPGSYYARKRRNML